jgi:peptide/nickel transport system ATP-binding protein
VSTDPLLDVRDLHVSFRTEDGVVRAVDGVSLKVNPGEVLGIVGESGSGKSVSMMSVMRLIIDPNAVFEGQVMYKDRDLMGLSQAQMQDVRGSEIAMIFQDPMTSLNPVYRIGWQIEEQLRAHQNLSSKEARARVVELLRAVGIPNPETRAADYPHQFSGGMRQRVMIAMALSCDPDLLIADEPTTALDVTIQAQILDLIKRLKAEFNSAVILITHDMGVVADIADRVMVMYAGRVVEEGTKHEIFTNPQHPYTWGLLDSIPRLDRPRPKRLSAIPGQPPSLVRLPPGCAFNPRCGHRFDRCLSEVPELKSSGEGEHRDACHLDQEAKQARRATGAAAADPSLAESV